MAKTAPLTGAVFVHYEHIIYETEETLPISRHGGLMLAS